MDENLSCGLGIREF